MKIVRQLFKDKQRACAIATMRGFMTRWGPTVGAELLGVALFQMQSGDVDGSRETLERFELAVPELSPVDRAMLQIIKDRLGVAFEWRRFLNIRVFLATLAIATISAVTVDKLRALLQNYSRNAICKTFGGSACCVAGSGGG